MPAIDEAVDLIASLEGLRLRPYLDSGGVPTIGYGSTRYEDGTAVTMQDPAVSSDRARDLLQCFVEKSMAAVQRLVTVPLSDNQLAALTSFEYNTGGLSQSTLLTYLNQGFYEAAAEQFPKWCHVQGKTIPGLIVRRTKEQQLFRGDND